MANVVATLNRPALVLAPNKTLAAQLYGEFKELFPDNAVEYFRITSYNVCYTKLLRLVGPALQTPVPGRFVTLVHENGSESNVSTELV